MMKILDYETVVTMLGYTPDDFRQIEHYTVFFNDFDMHEKSSEHYTLIQSYYIPVWLLSERDYLAMEEKFRQMGAVALPHQGITWTTYRGISVIPWKQSLSTMVYIPHLQLQKIAEPLHTKLKEYGKPYDYKVVCDETNNNTADVANLDLNVDVFLPMRMYETKVEIPNSSMSAEGMLEFMNEVKYGHIGINAPLPLVTDKTTSYSMEAIVDASKKRLLKEGLIAGEVEAMPGIVDPTNTVYFAGGMPSVSAIRHVPYCIMSVDHLNDLDKYVDGITDNEEIKAAIAAILKIARATVK